MIFLSDIIIQHILTFSLQVREHGDEDERPPSDIVPAHVGPTTCCGHGTLYSFYAYFIN